MTEEQDCISPWYLLPELSIIFAMCVCEREKPELQSGGEQCSQHITSTDGAVIQWENALYSQP